MVPGVILLAASKPVFRCRKAKKLSAIRTFVTDKKIENIRTYNVNFTPTKGITS